MMLCSFTGFNRNCRARLFFWPKRAQGAHGIWNLWVLACSMYTFLLVMAAGFVVGRFTEVMVRAAVRAAAAECRRCCGLCVFEESVERAATGTATPSHLSLQSPSVSGNCWRVAEHFCVQGPAGAGVNGKARRCDVGVFEDTVGCSARGPTPKPYLSLHWVRGIMVGSRGPVTNTGANATVRRCGAAVFEDTLRSEPSPPPHAPLSQPESQLTHRSHLRVRGRTVGVQGPVTYTGVKGASFPRFVPLRDCSWGADWE